jgi:hypothetical protein
MEISVRDLARLIELRKKKAELEFQKSVLGVHVDTELAAVSSSASGLEAKARGAGVELVFPDQDGLDALGKALAAFPPDALREALKVRDGKAFQTLKERGMIVKRNFANRFEIAKASVLISRMEAGERKALSGAISSGAVAAPLPIGSLQDEDKLGLARFLRRCGIRCVIAGAELRPCDEAVEKEVRLELQNRSVWVSEASRPHLEDNIRRMSDLNARIQLKNALRQVSRFSEEEEKDFATLQKEYLDLLKRQDELLKSYEDEEKLAAAR